MREAVGIDLAEEGTVGEAEVFHCVAHRLAQNVHVAGDVRGRHVVEDRPTAAITCARQRPVSLLLHGLLPRGHRDGNGGITDNVASKEGKHCSGVLRITPRGSNPTRSKRARNDSGRNWPIERTMSTPDAPGPPGLTNSEPIRCPRTAAGRRIRAKDTVAPSGR